MVFQTLLKIALASCVVTLASGAALASTVMTVSRSQETCKDTYVFKSIQDGGGASATVRNIVMTPADEAASKANMVGAGASAWPSTLTQGTHFTIHYHATAITCAAGTTVDVAADTTATGAAASGVLTLTFGANKGANNGVFCVVLKNVCTLAYPIVAAGNWVTTTTTVAPAAADTAATMGVTGVQTATNTKMTSAPFAFTPTAPLALIDNVMTVTPTFSQTAPAAADKVTISMKGFTQKTGSVCSIDNNDFTATVSDSVDKIILTLTSSILLLTTKVISCTKIQGTAGAVTAVVPNGFGITFGTGTDVDSHFYADTPAIGTGAPTPAFSAAPASAGGSIAALVLGSFAALCLLF